MSLVLDSSATLARIFVDEASALIDALFDRIAASGAVVPSLWRLEVANSLPLATLDRALAKAAKASGIIVLGLPA